MCVTSRISRSLSGSQTPQVRFFVNCFFFFFQNTSKTNTCLKCLCVHGHVRGFAKPRFVFPPLPCFFFFCTLPLSLCLFLSLLKCLPSVLVQEIAFSFHPLIFSLPLISLSSFSLCLPVSVSPFFPWVFPLPFDFPLRFALHLLACLPVCILSICLVFLLPRTHVRAVSCNSVVTLPVISNSLYTLLSICTPSPGNVLTYDNIAAVDNPVRFVTVRLIHHKGKPLVCAVSSILFFLLLDNNLLYSVLSVFQTYYQLYSILFSSMSVLIWNVLVVRFNETCLFCTCSRAI